MSIAEITKALVKFQGLTKTIERKQKNAFTKSSYANITDVVEAIRCNLSECELFVSQPVTNTANGIEIKTVVYHSSGQMIDFGTLEIFVSKKDAQAQGSAITYGRRYALMSALCLVSDDDVDDDDGNLAKSNRPDIIFISDRQAQELYDLCEDNQTVLDCLDSFLKSRKVSKLQQLDIKDYNKLKIAITKKLEETKL